MVRAVEAEVPPSLRKIHKYVKYANEMLPIDQMVSYYVLQYALEEGLKLRDKSDPNANKYIGLLLDEAEALGPKIPGTRDEHRVKMEEFAYGVFKAADDEDRAGRATKETAFAFFAAFSYIEVCQLFGELPIDLDEKRRYAKFKVSSILLALKEGRRPEPGGPGRIESDHEEQRDDASREQSMPGPERGQELASTYEEETAAGGTRSDFSAPAASSMYPDAAGTHDGYPDMSPPAPPGHSGYPDMSPPAPAAHSGYPDMSPPAPAAHSGYPDMSPPAPPAHSGYPGMPRPAPKGDSLNSEHPASMGYPGMFGPSAPQQGSSAPPAELVSDGEGVANPYASPVASQAYPSYGPPPSSGSAGAKPTGGYYPEYSDASTGRAGPYVPFNSRAKPTAGNGAGPPGSPASSSALYPGYGGATGTDASAVPARKEATVPASSAAPPYPTGARSNSSAPGGASAPAAAAAPATPRSLSIAPVPGYTPDVKDLSKAQKHAKNCASAIDFRDTTTAVKELKAALILLTGMKIE
ncbi:Mammalian lyst-interacting protein 5 [Porphyridium purpureum]|uniref:Mammalian lyst-interacting protein 5 n=1 Tax=Porphyridium purpureum TaxID=35688 RepID=A0A5J4YQI9_PORPP|nr:Mammalian lyst-interacting protein 5 [Porphyridium purpureum]|eukprot:POR6706..scf222_8